MDMWGISVRVICRAVLLMHDELLVRLHTVPSVILVQEELQVPVITQIRMEKGFSRQLITAQCPLVLRLFVMTAHTVSVVAVEEHAHIMAA